MTNRKIIVLIFIVAIITSCDNDDDNFNSPLENSDTIRIDDDLFLNAPNDDFQIISATISNNNLNLIIAYGGGCGEVYYDLVTANNYINTNPIQKNIRLAFNDQDNCEAGIELELSFDLTQVQISSTDRIIINLDKWEDQIEYNY